MADGEMLLPAALSDKRKTASAPTMGQKPLRFCDTTQIDASRRPLAPHTIICVPMDNGWEPVGIYCGNSPGSSRPQKPIQQNVQALLPPPKARFTSHGSAYFSFSKVWFVALCASVY